MNECCRRAHFGAQRRGERKTLLLFRFNLSVTYNTLKIQVDKKRTIIDGADLVGMEMYRKLENYIRNHVITKKKVNGVNRTFGDDNRKLISHELDYDRQFLCRNMSRKYCAKKNFPPSDK